MLHQAFDGLPMAHPGHIDVVYDSVAKPETFEVGVRVLAERGRLVYTGVAVPRAVGVDAGLLQGADHRRLQRLRHGGVRRVRRHAIEHYLGLVQDGRIDLTAMVTHRFPLEDWWEALKTLARPEESGVLKATFAPNGDPAPPRPEPLSPAGSALGGPAPRTARSARGGGRGPGRVGSIRRPARAQPPAASNEVSSPAAIRARKAAPRAAPSDTATVSTGRPVASATACIHGSDRDPPPVATIRRAVERRSAR